MLPRNPKLARYRHAAAVDAARCARGLASDGRRPSSALERSAPRSITPQTGRRLGVDEGLYARLTVRRKDMHSSWRMRGAAVKLDATVVGKAFDLAYDKAVFQLRGACFGFEGEGPLRRTVQLHKAG